MSYNTRAVMGKLTFPEIIQAGTTPLHAKQATLCRARVLCEGLRCLDCAFNVNIPILEPDQLDLINSMFEEVLSDE